MLQGNFTVTYRPVHSIPPIELSRAREEGRVDPILLDLPVIRKDCRLYCALISLGSQVRLGHQG